MAATSCPVCGLGYDDTYRSRECPHDLLPTVQEPTAQEPTQGEEPTVQEPDQDQQGGAL